MQVPVNEPLLDGNERKYLNECIDTGWISSDGPFISRFESGMAGKVGRLHGIAVANGSVALDVAVAALGIGPGDEVIVPTFTIISCAAAVVRAGAIPVVVDCDSLTWNATPEGIRARITPRTKAIMVVHLYGLPVDMDPILDLAREHGLKIIEDAAQAHGLTYRGRPCGGFGDVSTFSFYPNKLITTGEGGLVAVDDEALAARCRSLRNLCFQPARRFVHEELGWNFRMSNLQAAIGVAQIERWETFLEKKRWIGRAYQERLAGTPGIQLPQTSAHGTESSYWVFGLVLDEGLGTAADAAKKLGAGGVGTRPFFWPMHEQPVFLRQGLFAGESHPVSERIARQGLYLPSGMALTEAQIDHVAAIVKDTLK